MKLIYYNKYYNKHYNLLTNSLNLFPRSSKFLNISKLALAGENKTTCFGFAYSLAFFTASSNEVTL